MTPEQVRQLDQRLSGWRVQHADVESVWAA